MSLADRLNQALQKNRLQPVVRENSAPKTADIAELPSDRPVQESSKSYKTLKEGLKSAHKHTPDEFGTTVIVVEDIGDKIQLPMKAGKYIVDDIQKRTDGRYEVHLVSGQR